MEIKDNISSKRERVFLYKNDKVHRLEVEILFYLFERGLFHLVIENGYI